MISRKSIQILRDSSSIVTIPCKSPPPPPTKSPFFSLVSPKLALTPLNLLNPPPSIFFWARKNKNCPRKKLKTAQKVPENDCFSPKIFLKIYTRETKNSAREKKRKIVPEKTTKYPRKIWVYFFVLLNFA